MIPKILQDVKIALETDNITINEKVEGEGRGGSLQDEGAVKEKLFNHPILKNYVIDVPARGFGDIIILDYDKKTRYVVNIKTSIGSTDNCTSKLGFLYALTDLEIEELPRNVGWKKFYTLLETHKKNIPQKDYYFLCIDKNDSSNVMIRGSKSIRHWCRNANPSNLLQINWKKEKESSPVNRTYEEAYDTLIGGIKICYNKFIHNLPEEWLEDIINGI